MYESFWQQMGDKTTVVITRWQYISYFSDVKNLCWFLEPEFAKAVIRLHKLVGNAITEGRHIVVGTGSTQLFQAALYALCPPNASESMSVVSAAPYYSIPTTLMEVERNVLSNKIQEMEVERNTLSSKVQYMEAEFSSKVNNMEAQQAQLLKMFEEFRSTKTSST